MSDGGPRVSGPNQDVEDCGLSDGMPISEDEEEEESEEEAEWYPGDGICPSTLQFNSVRKASYAAWCLAATRQSDDSVFEPSYIDAFLDLLEDVPAFYRNPPENVDLVGRRKSPLIQRSFLRLDTTDNPSCDSPQKDIPYVQCLGFPEPMTYKVARGPLDSCAAPIGISLGRARSLTSIALAWSYVFSCRWVEILQDAGEHSSLCVQQSEHVATNFWDLVVQGRWSAQVKRGKGTFYAPWMLREDGFEKRNMYVGAHFPFSIFRFTFIFYLLILGFFFFFFGFLSGFLFSLM